MLIKKSPRVTLIGPSWPFRGGIAKYTTRLAEVLYQKGHLVDFITPVKQYPSWLYPGKSDQDPHACPQLEFSKPLFSYLEPWTWPNVVRAVRGSPCEKVLIPFWSSAHLPFLNYLYRHLSVPSVTILHNLFGHDSGMLARFLTRKVLKRSQHFLCHSSEIAMDPIFQDSSKSVRVQPLPLLLENKEISKASARTHLKIAAHHQVFLFFGLIRPYKGFSVLLEACQKLAPKVPFTLLVAGEPWGKLKKSVEFQLAQAKHHFSCISHLGWLPEEEVPLWFSASDTVVVPYLRATGSAVIAQAMNYQKPIVTTPVGGIPKQLSQYPRAFFSAPGDPISLSEKMLDSLKKNKNRPESDYQREESRWDSYVKDLFF